MKDGGGGHLMWNSETA